MSVILLIGLGVAALAALVVACWPLIKDFLNGPVRDFLEKTFGQDKCKWYGNFIAWCDGKAGISSLRRLAKMCWKKFKDTVLRINSVYKKNPDGSYTKRTESRLRKDEKTAWRIVTEETIGWEYLPSAVREEMIKRRTNEGEIDDMAIVQKKVDERAKEDGIELVA